MTKEQFIQKVNDLGLYSSGNNTQIGINYLKLSVGSHFNEYNSKYKKELEQLDRLNVSRNFLSIEHNIGGVSGGSCWDNSNPKEYFNSDKRPDFESLYKLLEELVPNISFLTVRKIEKELVKEFDYTDYEYYGNSTTNNVRYICLNDLYDFLYSNKLI